jgi:hypothetical protein
MRYIGGQSGQGGAMRAFGYRFVLGQATKIKDADVPKFTVQRVKRDADGVQLRDPETKQPIVEAVFLPGYELLPEDFSPTSTDEIAVQLEAPATLSGDAVEARREGRSRRVRTFHDDAVEEVSHG